jgi:putative SOS response-associated peptidase YedK
MCGRFGLTADTATLRARYRLATDDSIELSPRYNCAPMQRLPVILPENQDAWVMRLFQWGLVPAWQTEPTGNAPLINARCETITDKRSFADAFRLRRCLVPADAYYEWSSVGSMKKAYRIAIENEPLFSFAGLWEEHHSPDGTVIFSFALLTRDAIPALSVIHNRMPVILTPEQERVWLQSTTDLDVLQSFFTPPLNRHFNFYRVSDKVGNVRYDHSDLILPLTDVNQSALF